MSTEPKSIPSQKIKESVYKIPIEYFKWGVYPDHFKIDLPHRHEFAEFLFFSKGGGFHEIDFISHKILDCSIHMIPANTVHFLKRDQVSDGFTIAFDPQFLNSNSIHRIVYPLENEAFVMNLSASQFEYIKSIADIILMQIKSNKGFYKEKAFLLAMELLITTIANEVALHQLHKQDDEDRIIRKFKADIRSNVHLHTSVKYYAEQLNISSKHLSNHLRKKTNKSAKQWIIDQLLISIKKYLINTDLSIKEIAYHHQFNESSLSKLFKNHVGYTMTAYRSNKNMKF